MKASVNQSGFGRIGIVGVGLLGGSIGLAVRSILAESLISGWGHRRESLDRAVSVGAIEEAHEDLAGAVREADLVILCTPVGVMEQMLRGIGPALKAGAIVTDVGSTKRSIVEAAHRLLPAGVHFVGSHPMAGSEKRGVESARSDLFRNSTCLTTPTSATSSAALEQVERFWRLLGMRIVRISPEEHDRMLANVSHLPHAVAAALMAMQADEALALAGKGFLDSTRIAGGDGQLWRDIFQDNRDNLRTSLRAFRNKLDELAALLEPTEGERLAEWLSVAAARRGAMAGEKSREGGGG